MARIRYLIQILNILISVSSSFLFANITIYDTPLDVLFDKFNISLISNYGSVHYLNIIDDNINYIQFDNSDNRVQYLIDLRRAIDLGIANKWDDAIRHHIEETFIPQYEHWIVLSLQRNIT